MKVMYQKSLLAAWWFAVSLVWITWNGTVTAQGIATTTVQGAVYLANGQPGSGTLQVSWPAFTTATNQAIAAGRTNAAIGADGFVSLKLAPNQGATPAGLYYTAVYHLSDGSTSTEYWVVAAAAQASLSQIRAQVMPAAQAVQAVSKGYVDQSIQELTQNLLTASGGSLSGPLYLNGDPGQPAQAATKHYVDSTFSKAVPLSGGKLSGPLTSVQLGAAYQADQFPGADFGAKLQSCLNNLDPTYGGTCDARNFSGTLSISSNLVMSAANATVQLPCATISTASHIQISAGTRNITLHGCASRGASNASGSQGGTVFLYSGSGPLMQVGDATYTCDTLGFHLDNAVINTTASSASTAQGLAAYRTQEIHLDSLYFLGNSNQTGLTLDGTGNYTGGTFQDIQFGGYQTAVNAIGHQLPNSAVTDWVNAGAFLRLHINCPTSDGSPIAGTYGINLQQGDGNTFTGGDIEGCSTALHLGPNAQNNTIVGLRNENSINQVVAETGSSYNNWITGGTMFTGQLTDNGTRNSFLDTFHRSFNGLNGDWYGSQNDATVTNHFRIGTGAGNERGLLSRYQTDLGYRWTTGLSDATGGAQYYQILDELNNVYRLSIGQYNNGQSSTNNQTVINSAGTGAIVLNGSTNGGTGGVLFGAGGANGGAVASINNAGSGQFNGSLTVGGQSTFSGSTTVKNQTDAEIDSFLWAGATGNQKESFTYKDYTGASQWYMVKDASNNWALNSATGGLDSIKAYQSTNSGDTYINASNPAGHVRLNYESGSGSETDIYSGSGGSLVASFLGGNAIKFPGLASASGRNCLQIDNSGYISNTGAVCGGTNGMVNSGTSGQVAYYAGNGTVIAGTNAVALTAGGTGATTQAGALANLGAQAALPGISSDGASGVQVAGTVAAGSVNGVYDLKAAFGATGSQQTMTCTATAASNTLTGCTGGDFKIGNTIMIPSVGNAPTVSTPATPSPACNAQNGASCSGSVQYCYEIAGVQGLPNGALTAVSLPGCVTQAAQTLPAFSGTGIPAISTQITLPLVSNVSYYAIYRSVNGGAYSFYTIYTSGVFTDYGYWQSVLFTAADFMLPSAPPASPVRNDIYAQIAAVNGGTVTIAPLDNMPKMWQNGGYGFTTPYLTTPQTSGSVVVQHDDTPAFYKASVALINNSSGGQLKLHIPAGNYNLHDADPYGFGAVFHLNNMKNVTLAGDGDGTKLYQYNDRTMGASAFIVGVCGNNSYNPAGSCIGTGYPHLGGNEPAYNVVDPILAGANTVTLNNPSDASNFNPGMYVSLYTQMPTWSNSTTYSIGQMAQTAGVVYQSVQNGNLNNVQPSNPTWWTNIGNAYPADTYGELNKIATVDPVAGIVTLAYPTSKMYSANLTAPWNLCAKCSVTPYISPVLPGPVATNIILQDFWYRGHNLFDTYNTIDWLTKKDLTIIACCHEGEGFSRHVFVNNINLTEDSTYGRGSMLLSVAAGSADMSVTNSHYYSPRFGASGQYCSEGSANIVWRGNTFDVNGFGSSTNNAAALWGGGAYCWNFDFSDNNITLKNANLLTVFGSDGTATGKYANNDITVDSVGSTYGSSVHTPIETHLLSSTREPVIGNAWHIASGVGSLVNANAFTLPGYTTNTMTPQSGTVILYTGYMAAQTVLVIPMSGNITSLNFGGSRTQGLESYLVFQQPAAGGPYSLTSTFCSGSAPVLDCPNGIPALHTAANSYTYIRIQDDGTTYHILGTSNPTSGGLGDWANTGASVGKVPVCQTVVSGVCTSWAPGNSVTATSGLSDWSNASAAVNYVATCKGISGGSCTSWGPAAGGGGGPVLVQSIDLTNQAANLGLTAAYTTPAAVGSYLVTCYTVVTTAATTSSTLPTCGITFVDGDTGVNAANTSGNGNMALGVANTRNATGAISSNGSANTMYIHTAASSAIYYSTNGYASSGATPMQFALHLRIEYLGP
jgi:hypothetical protein